MDVEGGACENAARAIVWDRKMPPATNQLFRQDIIFFRHHIVSALGHNMVLDIEGCSEADGAPIILYQRKHHGSKNQNWELCFL